MDGINFRFADRAQAGVLLAEKLARYAQSADTIVLGLPRGGVAVAFELAVALALPLDVLVVRKLGVPGHEELAFGAIASGGVRILDPEVVEALEITPEIAEAVTAREQAELRRREAVFREGRAAPAVGDRNVILVDDGIATGSTMLSAIEAARRLGAKRVIVAAAVAPPQSVAMLSSHADEVVCLHTEADFRAVSLFFQSFPQLTDEDVRGFLDRAAQRKLWPPAA